MSQVLDAEIEDIERPASRHVATQRATAVASAPASALTMMEMAMRAASDPATDVAKIKAILDMVLELRAQEAEASFNRALAKLQPGLPIIKKNGRIEILDKASKEVIQSTKFAKWEDIHAAIMPILNKNGFSLSFRPSVEDGTGKIVTTGVLRHKDGHREEAAITLPHDSSGSKNAVQAVGSTLSYGQRYAAKMLLNFRTEGDDDDAAAADRFEGDDPNQWITAAQVADLSKLMDDAAVNRERFLDFLKIDTLARLPRSRHAEALSLIAQKKRQAAQAGH